MSDKLLSVAEAATALDVHRTRINQLIDSGVLPATRIGRAYVIRENDLQLVKERPAPGRPKKAEEAETRPAPPPHPPFPTDRPKKANGAKQAAKPNTQPKKRGK
jgi:excisionase family DNA binding protein